MLKTAFLDNAMGITQTFEWFSQFRHGETSVEDDVCSGYPSTSCTDKNMEKVAKLSRKTDEMPFWRLLTG
jgi:hypothetical protein